MKNLRKKLSYILYFVLFVVLLQSCYEKDVNIRRGTGVKQEWMDEYLVTIAKYKHETIWQSFDRIRLNTNDSIKIKRYNEAVKRVEKFKSVDK